MSEKYSTASLSLARKDSPKSISNSGVRSRPVQQKFGGRTESIIGSDHQRRQSLLVLGVWISTCFQQEFNKVEVGHDAPTRV
jgi:hypothetical protein